MTLTFTIPKDLWLTSNQRLHWAEQHGFRAHSWDNRSGPRGAGNTAEGLTRSLDLDKEGLA